MTPVKTGDDQEARFIAGAGRDLQQSRIPPEGLGGLEVDAVLAQVGVALLGRGPVTGEQVRDQTQSPF